MNLITAFHLQCTKYSNLDTILVGLCKYMQLSFKFLKIELKWFGIWVIFYEYFYVKAHQSGPKVANDVQFEISFPLYFKSSPMNQVFILFLNDV